jgi:hypothetical protein
LRKSNTVLRFLCVNAFRKLLICVIQFEKIQSKTLDQVLKAFQIRSKRSRDSEDALKEFAEICIIVGVDRCT